LAAVWGEAEVAIHIDGNTLPAEVRAAAVEAATVGGKAFQSQFRKAFRGAVANSVSDLARSLGNLFQSTILSSGAVRGLYQATRQLRTQFRTFGSQLKQFGSNTLGNIRRGFSDFTKDIREDHIKVMGELRESFRAMKPTIDDWRASFPRATAAIEKTGESIRNFRTSMREMGREFRDEQIKVMGDLRESFRAMKPSIDDLQQTFPGVTRVVRGTRRAFERVRDVAGEVSERFKSLGPDAADMAPAMDRLRESWRTLTLTFRQGRAGMDGAREGIANLQVAMNDLEAQTRETTAVADEANDAIGRRSRRSSRTGVGGIRALLSSWKRLPHGLRQAIFWIGLTIAALGSLSVLGSALSGTIVTLITMLTTLGAAAGIATAGFFGLFGEGENLTEGAQRAKTAFEELGAAFHGLQSGIVTAMFEDMAPSIQAITDALPKITDSLNGFATSVGDNIGRIFEALASDSSIATINALFDGMRPILDSLTTAAIGFGDAIGDILVVSLPFAQNFAAAIGDVATKFSEWTSSEEGRERIREFFETAERIMPPLVDTVVAIADALAGLVTETTITGFITFLDSVKEFAGVLGGLVGVVANLNVFGVLAAILVVFGEALAPLIVPLQTMATIIGEQLIIGLETLGPSFSKLGEALVPVIEFATVLITAILPTLFTIIDGGIQVITAIIDIFVALGEALFGTGEDTTLFGEVVTNVLGVIGPAFEVWNTLVVGGLEIIADLLRGDASAAWETFEGIVEGVCDALGINFDNVEVGMDVLKQKIKDVLSGIEGFFRGFGETVLDIFGGISSAISGLIGWFNDLFSAASNASSAASSASSAGGSGRIPVASGGLFRGPTRALIGEAGPEAVVPLRRSLSRVDPSVRWLSAIAQGITPPAMAAGGIVAGGRSVTVETINVNETGDSRRTANDVITRLAEFVNG